MKAGRHSVLIKLLIGITLGAVAGFCLYRFVGCKTGVCPITRNPYISTAYGAILGALLAHGVG